MIAVSSGKVTVVDRLDGLDREGRRPRDAALAAFAAQKAEIDVALARLASLSADHFRISPEDVNWGGVTGLAHVRNLLCQATNFAFGEVGGGDSGDDEEVA